jgi:hypothetical protein
MSFAPRSCCGAKALAQPCIFTQSISLSNIVAERRSACSALGRREKPYRFLLKGRSPRPDSSGGAPSFGQEAKSRGKGSGGADRDRTGDPLLAKQVLSQLSYSPVGKDGGPG